MIDLIPPENESSYIITSISCSKIADVWDQPSAQHLQVRLIPGRITSHLSWQKLDHAQLLLNHSISLFLLQIPEKPLLNYCR